MHQYLCIETLKLVNMLRVHASPYQVVLYQKLMNSSSLLVYLEILEPLEMIQLSPNARQVGSFELLLLRGLQ